MLKRVIKKRAQIAVGDLKAIGIALVFGALALAIIFIFKEKISSAFSYVTNCLNYGC